MQRRVFLSSASAAVWASAQPASPAETIFREWLTAFNSGDRAQMEAYAQARDPQWLKRLDRALEFRQMTGGFDLVAIEKVTATSVTARLKERNSPTLAVADLAVAGDPPKVTSHRIEAIPGASAPSSERVTFPEALQALETEAEKRTREDRFAGVVLIARGGQVKLHKAYGLADRTEKRPIALDTQFRIGSMNKMFTAVAALRLVEQGKLSLEDTIGRHLPDYPNAAVAAKVKLRHLLSHTGGTGDIFGPQFEEQRLKLRTHADYVKLYGSRAPEFEPGTKWAYSNYGMVLAGALMERATGEDYYAAVRRLVFTPAGMTSTDSLPESEAVANRAAGYMRNEKRDAWISNADTLPWRGTAAGGGYSTAGDLFRFAEALRGGKLLSARWLKEATTVQGKPERAPEGNGYGFGLMVSAHPTRYGHGGGAPGMNGELAIFPDLGVVVAVLSNLDPPAAGSLANVFIQRMPLA
jgi:CubicO group peptidase (beta-lactamase class C family)